MFRLTLALTYAVIACFAAGSLLKAATLSPDPISTPSATGVRFVAASGNDASNCTDSANPCATVQHALNIAASGDEIRMAAGRYTPTQAFENFVVVGLISTSLVLRGGFTATNWVTPDRQNNRTILDAQGKGPVLVVGIGYFNATSDVTIDGLNITGGRWFGPGGGVSVLRAGGITLTNNIIVNNSAYDGGGVFVQDTPITLIGNSILGNIATPLGGPGGAGGGVFLNGNGYVDMSNNIVAGNQAPNGMAGGVYLCGANVTFAHNLVMNNLAGQDGGLSHCINQPAVPVTITGNTFMGNRAVDLTYGVCGGLCLNSQSPIPAYVYDNLITDNEARLGGGGLHIASSSPLLVNNVVRSNHSGSGGSGVQVDGGSPRLVHTTINQNSGGDGAIVIGNIGQGFSSHVAMTNTIVANSTTGLVVSATNSASLNGILWYGNAVNVSGAGLVTTKIAHAGNPAFATDGYHLTPGSMAVDVGVSTQIDEDIDGEPRPYGIGPDIGADEYVGPTWHTYMPFILR